MRSGYALLMRLRRYEAGFVVGVDNEACFALVRLFYILAFAIIYGNFIPVPTVRIVGAKLCCVQDYLVGDGFIIRHDNCVRGMVFLRVQPNILARSTFQKSIVLQVIST